MKTKLEKLTAGLSRKLGKTAKPGAVPIAAAKPAAAGVDAGGVSRFSLSLHATDSQRIDEIQSYLRDLGHRESNRSLLVKVALRGVKLTPELVNHLQAAQAGDGRRNR